MYKRPFRDTGFELEDFDINGQYCQDVKVKPEIYYTNDNFNGLLNTINHLQSGFIDNIQISRETSTHGGLTPNEAILSVNKKLERLSSTQGNITMNLQEACVLELAMELFNILKPEDTPDSVVDLSSEIATPSISEITPYNPVQINISNGEITIHVPIDGTVSLSPIAQTTLANLLNLELADRTVQINPDDIFQHELENLYFDILKTIREYITSIRTNLGRNDILLSSTIIFAYHMFRHIVKYLWLMNNQYHIVGCALSLSFRILNLILSWLGYIFVILLHIPCGVMFLFLTYLYFA